MMEDYDDLKLGCHIPDRVRPAVEFRSIVASRESKTLLEDVPGQQVDPLAPTSDRDNLAPFDGWKMLGNNRYTDCVAVTWANTRRLISSKLAGRENYPSIDQVMKLYSTQNSELDPRMPMVSDKVFQYLVKNGGPDGVRALAYARVDWKNVHEIRQALTIFGALWIEFTVSANNQEEFDYKKPWTPHSPEDVKGGHAVLAGGYSADGGLKIITWGQTAQLSEGFVKKCVRGAWVIVWPEHLGSRRFTRGINVERLRAEFKRLNPDQVLDPMQEKLNSILVTYETEGKTHLNVHKLEPDRNAIGGQWYSATPSRSVTPITKRNASRAILVVDNDDLYLIQTTETVSDCVEVQHVLAPRYFDLESATSTVTTFKCKNSSSGTFCIDNGDLYFVKLPKVGDRIEVHWAPSERRFQAVEKYVTAIQRPSGDLRAVISGGDLYLLIQNEDSEYLQVHCAQGNANYASFTRNETGLRVDEISKIYSVGMNGDIYVIQDQQWTHGKIEVWIATARSSYKQIQKFVTSVDWARTTDTKARWIV